MPRIKRWFPVSQDINADPELWELTDKFGDRSLRVWLEILSIADRNDGELPGPWKDYPSILAGRCKSTTRHLREVCEWVARWLRVDSEGVARVRNYPKYHKTREPNKFPSEPSEPSESYSDKNQNWKPASPEPPADLKKPNGLDPEIRQQADLIFQSDPIKFKKLVVWIKQAQKGNWTDRSIALSLREFYPHREVIENWWQYLDAIIEKLDKDLNAAEHDRKHQEFKTTIKETARLLAKGKTRNA